MSNLGRKQVTISLAYFKQGDDVSRCLVKNDDDTVNTKETINNHITLLESVIEHLKSINDVIPDVNTCTIHGDTHYICIEGDERIINQLVEKELAYIDEFGDEEELTDLTGEPNVDDSDSLIDNDANGDDNNDENINNN